MLLELTAVVTSGVQGWQGVQTLPRVVSLDYDTPAMIMVPPAEVESLRLAQLYDAHGAALDGPSNTRVRPCAAVCAELCRWSRSGRGMTSEAACPWHRQLCRVAMLFLTPCGS